MVLLNDTMIELYTTVYRLYNVKVILQLRTSTTLKGRTLCSTSACLFSNSEEFAKDTSQ